jgi:hypothetical protein
MLRCWVNHGPPPTRSAGQAIQYDFLLPPAGPQAQGWTGKCKSGHCQCLAEAGKGGAYAPIPGDDEHQDEGLEDSRHPGLPPRTPRLWARRPLFFHHPASCADAAGVPRAPRL